MISLQFLRLPINVETEVQNQWFDLDSGVTLTAEVSPTVLASSFLAERECKYRLSDHFLHDFPSHRVVFVHSHIFLSHNSIDNRPIP